MHPVGRLIQKTQGQVELLRCKVMAPPSTGPRTPEHTMQTPAYVAIMLLRSGGSMVIVTTMHIEYMPQPPDPCRARKMILNK